VALAITQLVNPAAGTAFIDITSLAMAAAMVRPRAFNTTITPAHEKTTRFWWM